MHRLTPVAAFATLLFATAVAAAPPPAARSVPAQAATSASHKLSPADQKRVAAIQQYQHDLVNVVALRADPEYLLGAAILAAPFKHQIAGLGFDALSARAAAAPSAGPAPYWSRLGVCKGTANCPNAQAFDYLKEHAADNAAVWLIALDVAARDKNAAAEHAALKRAAAADAYDDYYGKALAGVAKAVGVLPPLPDTTAGASSGEPNNPDGVRVLVSVMNTESYIRPEFGPLVKLCSAESAAKDASLKAECLKVSHALRWGSSPIGRAVGLRIQGGLDPAMKARDDQESRNLAWQIKQYSGLLQHALVDKSLASQWLAAARNGGTELSLILATLRANQVPLEAPAGGTAPASAAGTGQ
ncbi:MAG TPA: hypothetical protein VF292_07600 [Rhodanobacteraceae bacterium]